MLVLGVSIFINRKQIPVLSKSLQWQARVIAIVLCIVLFCNIFGIASVKTYHMLYFWWSGFEWLRYVMLFLITAWLWQFAYIKPKEYLSTKPLGNCGLAVSIGVGGVLLLMFISLVHVLFTGHVAGFRTNVLISWLKPISALVLMGMYLLVHRLSLSITPESYSGILYLSPLNCSSPHERPLNCDTVAASTPYTKKNTKKNAIFICISAKKVVPLQRKLSKIQNKIE